MKKHRTLKNIGNICFTVASVNTAEGTATVKVTDRSKSTNPGLLDRLYDVRSLVTVMAVRFPIKGCFDQIQHHRLRGVAELEAGDKLNAVVFHDEALKEISIVSVSEEHFLRNELGRYGNGASAEKSRSKNRDQVPEQKDVTSSYDLAQAFKQNGGHEQDSTDDGGPDREDVNGTCKIHDIREGHGHHRPTTRRRQTQTHQRNQAA